MSKPRLLDLFCGVGGAGMGYARAGFDVVGIDLKPQPRYPFEFVQGDALEYLDAHGLEFDVIHASPPCQKYSRASLLAEHQGRTRSTVDLVEPVLAILGTLEVPWVVENVEGAPLEGVTLCGSAFGLRVRRHRLFASSALLFGPGECRHLEQGTPVGVYGRINDRVQGTSSTGRYVMGGQTARTVAEAQEALGIRWTSKWNELKEAIPPAYTEWLGHQLIAAL